MPLAHQNTKFYWLFRFSNSPPRVSYNNDFMLYGLLRPDYRYLLSNRLETIVNTLGMPLHDLANKLLLRESENPESERDINTFTRTNGRLYYLLNASLYNRNAQSLAAWRNYGLRNMGESTRSRVD